MLLGEFNTHVGQYQIRGRLGGSRAQIYRVWNPADNRTLALKLLTKAAADNDARARFVQEAQVLATIVHPNVVNVYASGEDQHGQPYFVMDLLQGQTLKQGIHRGNLGPVRERVLLALQLAKAIEHLHSLHIRHRRLRPEHIHVDHQHKLRVLNVGIAQHDTESRFRAPEALSGDEVTRSGDIYAFGVIFYELLGGESNGSAGRVPLRDVPRPLQELIRRCASRSAEQRPESFTAIIRDLESWLADPASTTSAGSSRRPLYIPKQRIPIIAAAGLTLLCTCAYFAYLGGYHLGQHERVVRKVVAAQSHR